MAASARDAPSVMERAKCTRREAATARLQPAMWHDGGDDDGGGGGGGGDDYVADDEDRTMHMGISGTWL
jgi:hypothetical protein